MSIQNGHDLNINSSQLSDVHGDQNIHHHVHSLQVDGQNNAAILHENHRGTLDNRIISDNRGNMVIFAQDQNYQLTLDGLDLPFLMNRSRERGPPNPPCPLGSESQSSVPMGDVGASIASRHINITNNTGQIFIIEQVDNNRAHSRTISATPTQPPITSHQLPRVFSHSARQDLPVGPPTPSFGGQYPVSDDKTLLTPPTLDSMTSSSPSEMIASSASAERGHNDNVVTARLPASSAASVVPPAATTAPDQRAVNSMSESFPPPYGAPSALSATCMMGSGEPPRDAQAQLQSDVVGTATGAPNREPTNSCTTTVVDIMPDEPGEGLQVLSAPGAPKPNKKRMNILWSLWQRVLRMFKGWNKGKSV